MLVFFAKLELIGTHGNPLELIGTNGNPLELIGIPGNPYESMLVPYELMLVPLSQKNENLNWHNWAAIWSYRALVDAIGLQIWRSFTWAGSQGLVSARKEK